MRHILKIKGFMVLILALLLKKSTFAQDEGSVSFTKRYLKPTMTVNSFFMPESKSVREDLGLRAYAYNQHTVSGFFPFYTWSKLRKDEVSRSTLQLIATGGVTVSNLYFDGLKIDRDLSFLRMSAGLRGIYSSGRSVVFASLSPFVAEEVREFSNPTLRWAGTLLFNYTWDYNFSTRVGVTRTFLFGIPNPFSENNFIPLPVLGVRIGPLDGLHLDMTFPRYY
ncbi:MAG: hypothetical protein SNJ77_11615, partial [Cytophagales bacterium]